MILGEWEVVWKKHNDGTNYIIWMEIMGLNEWFMCIALRGILRAQ
jgi:hypothetical protein